MRSVCAALAFLSISVSSALSQEIMGEEYSCLMCHTEMRADFSEGVHSSRGIQCTDCHGGDPTQFEIETAHSGGFAGALNKSEAVAQCLTCHGDIPQMRQYALEPVTREMFLESRHGQGLLMEGDTLAPSCGDCHGAHAIFPRTDPRSPVNAARISETCSACHSDGARVPAGLATDQFEDWSESAHGEALHERHNEKYAQCASCHGSHSALPPGVQEIPNVCGKCHQLVREAYFKGPHGGSDESTGGGTPCTGCHANHGTTMPSFTEIGGLCEGCHGAGSQESTSGLQLQELIAKAEAAGERARDAVRTLIVAGERTEDEEIRLLEVETDLRELMVLAHSLDPDSVENLTMGISSWSEGITQRAESVEEHRWERKLLAIPFWVLLTGGILLALRKRRKLAARDGDGTWGMDGGMES